MDETRRAEGGRGRAHRLAELFDALEALCVSVEQELEWTEPHKCPDTGITLSQSDHHCDRCESNQALRDDVEWARKVLAKRVDDQRSEGFRRAVRALRLAAEEPQS